MNGRAWIVVFLSLFLFPYSATAQEELKVFISVDMEGIAGVVVSEECSSSGPDYGYFRRIMSHEANAAVLGAFDAGATEVVVRDSHGSARNILPDLIDPRAKLLRDWSGGPKGMMEGIDESFDAVVFVGYHARAGTADAIIDHTMSGNVMDLSINGQSLPEAGANALIAGHFGVPVVYVAGDQGIVDQVEDLFGSVGTFATKQGIGASSLGLHPEVAQKEIRAGVADAVRSRADFEPFTMTKPYTMVLKLKSEASVYNGSFFPGAQRTGDWELTFSNDNILNVMYAFGVMRR